MRFSVTTPTFLLVLTVLFFSTLPANGQHPEVLQNAVKAHGGLSTWRSFHSLSFDLVRGDKSQQHLIDLNSRKSRFDDDTYTIGYDGENVWVAPDASAFSGNPQFYNGLYFYFFAMPFVFTDPGVNAEYLGEKVLGDKSYNVVEIGYDDGVGGSPNDTYLAHFDLATNRLSVLLYTVTFSSGAPSTNYNAMVFEQWQDVQGLLVPSRIVSHPWDKEKEQLGAARGTMDFENVLFDTSAPESHLFEKPDQAVYSTSNN